jgi:hypothetical protein
MANFIRTWLPDKASKPLLGETSIIKWGFYEIYEGDEYLLSYTKESWRYLYLKINEINIKVKGLGLEWVGTLPEEDESSYDTRYMPSSISIPTILTESIPTRHKPYYRFSPCHASCGEEILTTYPTFQRHWPEEIRGHIKFVFSYAYDPKSISKNSKEEKYLVEERLTFAEFFKFIATGYLSSGNSNATISRIELKRSGMKPKPKEVIPPKDFEDIFD